MDNQYLTDQTTSIDDYSKSLEYIIHNATVKSKVQSEKFYSIGDGIVSKGFYLGQNLTKNLAEIELHGSNSCILSVPSEGQYETRLSQKFFKTNTPASGSIFLPTDSLQYLTSNDIVVDLMIIIEYEQLIPQLEKNYHLRNIKGDSVELDFRNPKVQVVYDLITNNLKLLKLYPQLQDSLNFKASIKETAKLILTELIASSFNIDLKLKESPESTLVRKAEELMDANPEEYYSIQQIADMVATSPRNLQLAFKKHRSYSPMQFLKERKLYKARTLLLNGDSDTLVKKIAIDSGFLNLSSFSKYYQELFRELPSDTLKDS
jgi:AraC-like DNA-binding protein